MSLYRKYRPQNFENLVGQDHVRITLVNALKLDKVSHAYLFTGPRGTGKTSTARILAKAVNCLNLKDALACEECEICRDISDGRLIDLIEIDAASNRGIDEIRDLREKINFSPTRARSKVYIIDEVHMLTKEAFNALLKTLEEPPSHVYFILATTEVHKIPETILSRCLRFDFKRIDDKTMVDRLKFIAQQEKVEAEEKALEAIAHTAQGGLRDAIGLLEQLTVENKLTFAHVCNILGLSGYASIEKLYDFLASQDVKAALDEIHQLYTEGYDLHQFNKSFLEHLRKKMLESVEGGRTAETAGILKLVNYFQEAYEQSRFATITQLPLEMAVIQSCLVTGYTNALNKPRHGGANQHGAAAAQAGSAPADREHKGLEKSARADFGKQSDQGATVAENQIGLENAQSDPKSVPHRLSGVFDGHRSQIEYDEQKMQTAADKTAGTSFVLAIESIQAQWPRVLEHVKTPVVKRAFQQCSLTKVAGNVVTVAFSNKFQLEKMMELPNRTELEKAFADVFKTELKIIGELKPIAQEMIEANALADQVADIFEGEVV